MTNTNSYTEAVVTVRTHFRRLKVEVRYREITAANPDDIKAVNFASLVLEDDGEWHRIDFPVRHGCKIAVGEYRVVESCTKNDLLSLIDEDEGESNMPQPGAYFRQSSAYAFDEEGKPVEVQLLGAYVGRPEHYPYAAPLIELPLKSDGSWYQLPHLIVYRGEVAFGWYKAVPL